MATSDTIHVALLAAPEVSASTLYGFHDVLCGTRRDWQMLHGQTATASPFAVHVVSRDGQPLVGANGVRIVPTASFAELPRPDVVCITDMMVTPGESLEGRYDAEVAWIRDAHAAGATLASACSGAVLLAHTGLLEGLDATSHWAYCPALSLRHPSTRWHAERSLVVSGDGQRIVMGGTGMSWHMLVLALIARFASPEEAMQVARVNLLDVNTVAPTVYASLTRSPAQADEDPAILRCRLWAAEHYASESPVTQMARHSGLPERSFKRRFTQATGMSPLEYVHTVRLEEAKQMLEAGDDPVEAIAVEVGYQDASFFGRLFRRKVGLTPAQYRRRFGSLRRSLRGVSERVG